MTGNLKTATKTAVLTGAGSPRGIGRATAEHLARQGWAIAILDLNGDLAVEAAQDLSTRVSTPVMGAAVDVADAASVDEAVARVEGELPPIGALVNLAGISSSTPFLEMSEGEWDRVHAINLRGSFTATKRVLPGMIERRDGRIVSLSSISAQRGGGTFSTVAYSASKAGIIGFTRALAREVGEYGITVNAVAPGPIDTDIMGGTLTAERKEQLSRDVMLKRVGTREDVASLIGFLVSAEAGYITAATYDINGGLQVS